MRVTVNGEAREVPDGITVTGLLAAIEVTAERVAVEVNREIVPRSLHADHAIREGDRIEIVTMVGGG